MTKIQLKNQNTNLRVEQKSPKLKLTKQNNKVKVAQKTPKIKLTKESTTLRIKQNTPKFNIKEIKPADIRLKRVGERGLKGDDGDDGEYPLVIQPDTPVVEDQDKIWVDTDDNTSLYLPEGGTTGQVLAKTSDDNFQAGWVDQTGGGGGAVDSVNDQTGVVQLDAEDIPFDDSAVDPGTGISGDNMQDIALSIINASLVLGETDTTAYRGDRGKTAYDHSQVTTGNPHSVTKTEVGLSDVPNVDATDRANHTGTQTASTISDFQSNVTSNTEVTANTTARHTHSNQALLDTYDQTNTDIIDAISKAHDPVDISGKQDTLVSGTNIKTINGSQVLGSGDIPIVIPDPAYYQYIYNSSGSQAGNRFNNWADLITAIDGREAVIQFQQNEVLPVGNWNIDYTTWKGNGQNPDGGGLVIEFPEGCYIDSALNWQNQNGLNLYSSATTHPTYTMSVAHVIGFDRTAIYTDDIEFIKVTANGLVAIQCANGFGLYNEPAENLGNYEVFNVDSTPYGTVVVTTENGISPTIQNNTIRSVTPIVYGWLKQTSEATAEFATQANVAEFSVNFNGEPGGFGGSLFANAAVVGFPQGQPEGITSTNVKSALAEVQSNIVYSEYIYDSTATQSKNVYSNWQDLIDTINANGNPYSRITFNQPETLPAGTYNMDNVALKGNGKSPQPGGDGALVTLSDGFKISSWRNARIEGSFGLLSASSDYVMELTDEFIMEVVNQSIIASAGQPVFAFMADDLTFTLKLQLNGNIYGSSVGLNEVIDFQNFDSQVTALVGDTASSVGSDTIKGTNGVYLRVVSSSSTAFDFLSNTQTNFSGTITEFIAPQGFNIGYDNATSGLTSTNVQGAIDELKTLIDGYHP